MNNPIVNFSDTNSYQIYGKDDLEKPSEELKKEIELFLEDLTVLFNENNLKDHAKLYEKYPNVKISLRRALFVIDKREYLKRREKDFYVPIIDDEEIPEWQQWMDRHWILVLSASVLFVVIFISCL